MSKTLLTGSEIIQKKCSQLHRLPSGGDKLYAPTNSWLETKQIQACLEEKRLFVSQERIERISALSTAEWVPIRKEAKVLKKTGKHWDKFGHTVDSVVWLYPEETLHLVETQCLLLYYNDVLLSVEQCYAVLDGGTDKYRVFSHLTRLGYRVRRHVSVKRSEPEDESDVIFVSNEPPLIVIDSDEETDVVFVSEARCRSWYATVSRFLAPTVNDDPAKTVPNFTDEVASFPCMSRQPKVLHTPKSCWTPKGVEPKHVSYRMNVDFQESRSSTPDVVEVPSSIPVHRFPLDSPMLRHACLAYTRNFRCHTPYFNHRLHSPINRWHFRGRHKRSYERNKLKKSPTLPPPVSLVSDSESEEEVRLIDSEPVTKKSKTSDPETIETVDDPIVIDSTNEIPNRLGDKADLNCEESEQQRTITKLSSWQELKRIVDDTGERSNPFFRPGADLTSVYESLQIFGPIDSPKESVQFEVAYDLYFTSGECRRGQTLPNYRIIMTKSSDVVPSKSEIDSLKVLYPDGVPFLFVVVFEEAIGFYLFDSVLVEVSL